MNLDIFLDSGFVKLATYLITALVFAFVVFHVTFFGEPVIFWNGHSPSSTDRREERTHVGLKGRRDEKELPERPGEIV
jgi:hypothetical protein